MPHMTYDIFLCLTYFTIFSIIISWPIHVAPSDIISFFLKLSNIPLFICTTFFFFTNSSVNGRLGCFHVLAIVNSVAVTTEVHVPFWIYDFLRIYVQKWDCWIIQQFCFCFFLRNPHILLHGGNTTVHSHQQHGNVSISPHSLQHLLFIDFFDDGHSDWCEVIPHCNFDLHFSDNQ